MVSIKVFSDYTIDDDHFVKIFNKSPQKNISEKEMIDSPFKILIKVKFVLNGILKNDKESVLFTNNINIPKSLM